MRAFALAFSAFFSAFLAALVCCFACFLAFFGPFFASSAVSARAPTTALISSSSSRWAYQMSIVRIRANEAMASRYAVTDAIVTSRVSALEKPLLRAAMVTLAAIRFTSYSNGPGRVSSKSFRSNRSCRSGDAYPPKFDRCASPHNCTSSPAVGVDARSAAMIAAEPR